MKNEYMLFGKIANREELFNYFFDLLDELELSNYTPMYTREVILESFIQIDKKPYEYLNKLSNSVRRK